MISLLIALLGCTDSTTTSLPICDVTLTAAEPTSALAGESVVLTGSPMTDSWDTAIYFGTERGLVTEVDRSTCGDCDECRETNGCTACGDCDVCDALCDADCTETLSVEVPAVASGIVEVLMYNAYGVSTPLAFTVDAAGDTADTSGSDTGDSGNAQDTATDTAADTAADTSTPGDTASPVDTADSGN